MRFSYQLLPEQPLEEILDVIELLEELGFWACYCADETYHKDMWLIFAAAAARTSRLRMGPEVTNIILKEPTIIAQQAATLDELTGGRAELVFSTGNFAMLKQYRVNLDGMKPIRRLREAHEVMSTFLADGKIDFQGDYYAYKGLFTAARPVQAPFPTTPLSLTHARHSTSPLTHSVAEPNAPNATGQNSISQTTCWARSPRTQTRLAKQPVSSPPSTSPQCPRSS
jgi:alkanesulfonate monooxygenase SsuD/methylene tetrahydromethanopterin reductase-like flavin-dependent oxidoreductase (luciferase family)